MCFGSPHLMPLFLAVVGAAPACGPPGQPIDSHGPALDAPLSGIDEDVAARVELARRAVRADASNTEPWAELGLACEASGLFGLAVDAYTRLQRLEPRQPRWWYRCAVALEEQSRTSEARAAMRRALALGFEHACAHWRLGFLELERGDLEAAQEAFGAARRLDPGDAAGWIGAGRVHLQRDEAEAAARALEEALRRAPGDGHARGLLGAAYRAAGRWREAEPLLSAGLSVGPRFPDRCEAEVRAHLVDSLHARLESAKDLLRLGQPAEAVPLLEQAARERADDVGTLQLLARAYDAAGRLAEARAAWERCLALEPENLWTLVNAAILLGRLGELDEALGRCDRALALEPSFGVANEVKGGLLLAAGRKGEAVRAYRDGMRYDQRNRAVPLRIALLELEFERFAQAAELLEPLTNPARGAAPPEAYVALARAYEGLDRIADARAALARMPAMPRDPTALQAVRATLEERQRAGDPR